MVETLVIHAPAVADPSNSEVARLAGPRIVAMMSSRASVPPRQLVAPGPSEEERALLIRAALASPSHGGLRNFRFIEIGDDRRDALADVFVCAKREEVPHADNDDLARARDKAYNAPYLLLIVARVFADHPDIPAIEQMASAGVALGAVLHGAHMLGFGAMAVSGDKLATHAFRDAFGLAAFEHAISFVAIGTPSKPPRAKARLNAAEFVVRW